MQSPRTNVKRLKSKPTKKREKTEAEWEAELSKFGSDTIRQGRKSYSFTLAEKHKAYAESKAWALYGARDRTMEQAIGYWLESLIRHDFHNNPEKVAFANSRTISGELR